MLAHRHRSSAADAPQGAQRGTAPAARARRSVSGLCRAHRPVPPQAAASLAMPRLGSRIARRLRRQRRCSRRCAAAAMLRSLATACAGRAHGATDRRHPRSMRQPRSESSRSVPERISERDVREVLSQAPAPRIINLQGSVPLVTMAPFAEFLAAMGYPKERLRNPDDGSLTYSSYVDAAAPRRQPGVVLRARRHDADAHRPQPGRHGRDQGAARTGRRLRSIAAGVGSAARGGRGAHRHRRPAERRAATGGRAAALPTWPCWPPASCRACCSASGRCSARLREIPDTVAEFTGFSLQWDLDRRQFRQRRAVSGPRLGARAQRDAAGEREPSHAAAGEGAGARPGDAALDRPLQPRTATRQRCRPIPRLDLANLLHAADIWYSVKKHWCLEAQQLIRARRGQEGSLP